VCVKLYVASIPLLIKK